MDTVVYFMDSSAFGGAEQALLTLLKGLDRSRWRAVLFHHPEPGIAQLVRGARALGAELVEVPRLDRGQRFRAAKTFLRELAGQRPAIFHAHLTWPLACSEALLLAAAARVPARMATTQLYVELPPDVLLRIKTRLIIVSVHRYIAVSRDTASRLRSLGVPRGKIEVVHNSVEVHSGAAMQSRPCAFGQSNGRCIIFTPARLTEQKGHRYLLQAATEVPGAIFVFAGDGPERSALERQASELGIADRVWFLGNRDDVPALLDQCDLFVLPCLFEGLPLSVLEAMAAGKPVIASAIGGTDEAVSHGETGLLVPPADPRALALAINTLLSDRELAQRLAAAGQRRAIAEFSTEEMVRRTTGIYETLLAGA
jgi:glycosyltransferase involved in cell wall biosynthesis